MSSHPRLIGAPPWGRPQPLRSTGSNRHTPADLVVVGADVAGLTAAVRAAEAGAAVTVVSQEPAPAAAVPGWLTTLQGELAHDIRLLHGEPAVRAWVTQSERAVAHVRHHASRLGVPVNGRDFGLATVDGQWAFQLRFVARALRIGGVTVDFADHSGAGFPLRPELIVPDGAVINPVRWLDALAAEAAELGVRIVPGVMSGLRVDRDIATVDTSVAEVRAHRVMLSGLLPAADRAALRIRTRTDHWHFVAVEGVEAPYRELQLTDSPAMVMSSFDGRLVIGQRGGAAADVLAWTGRNLPQARITHGWSAETSRSIDALPLVGSASFTGASVLTASGCDLWSYTTGTAAGLQLADVALGRSSAGELPWQPWRIPTANGLSKRTRSALIGPIPWIVRLNTRRSRR